MAFLGPRYILSFYSMEVLLFLHYPQTKILTLSLFYFIAPGYHTTMPEGFTDATPYSTDTPSNGRASEKGPGTKVGYSEIFGNFQKSLRK